MGLSCLLLYLLARQLRGSKDDHSGLTLCQGRATFKPTLKFSQLFYCIDRRHGPIQICHIRTSSVARHCLNLSCEVLIIMVETITRQKRKQENGKICMQCQRVAGMPCAFGAALTGGSDFGTPAPACFGGGGPFTGGILGSAMITGAFGGGGSSIAGFGIGAGGIAAGKPSRQLSSGTAAAFGSAAFGSAAFALGCHEERLWLPLQLPRQLWF